METNVIGSIKIKLMKINHKSAAGDNVFVKNHSKGKSNFVTIK